MAEKMCRLRIVHMVYALLFGGVETMLVNIVNEQSKNNDVFLIIVNDLINETLLNQISANVKVVQIRRMPKSRNPFYVLKMNWEIVKIYPDIIHLHSSTIIKYIVPFIFKRRICVTHHDSKITLDNKECLQRIGHIYAISPIVQSCIKENVGKKSTVVLNGICFKNFKHRDKKRGDDFFRIVQISRLNHMHKGQDILIQALAILNKSDEGGKIKVDFIGKGPSLEYLEKLSQDFDVMGQAFFVGAKTQEYIKENLCNYDLLVQPSRYEGFGLTVVEAMAANVPVLVSSGTGLCEIVEDGKYGAVFQNASAEDCAEKIKDIMGNAAVTKISLESYKHALSVYDVKNTAQKYLEEYKRFARC